MERPEKNYDIGIITLAVMIFMLLVVYILPSASVSRHYIGPLNESNKVIAESYCEGFTVGYDYGCDHISVFCERFWYPVHVYHDCYAGRKNVVWRIK